jgi:hypothetical protein
MNLKSPLKRQRHDEVSPFVISQEFWNPTPKRVKHAHNFSDSPSVVSLSQTSEEGLDESFAESMPQSPVSSNKPVEWWKQQKHQPSEPQCDGACFVCQRSLPRETVEHAATGMRRNALLAYLTPLNDSHACKPRAACKPMQPILDRQDLCSFCERATCNDCMAQCEECGDQYCSFCRTIDYCGAISRTLCLDCSNERTTGNDEDAMNID